MPAPKDPEKREMWLEALRANAKKRMSDPINRQILSEKATGRPGPNKGKIMSAEQKAKISMANKGKTPPNKGVPLSDEQKAHLSAINTGKKHSPETIEKLRRISSRPRPELKGRPAHNKGKPMSEEQKAKISVSRKGKKRSAEAEARAAESNRGKKRTPEQCAKIGAIHRGKIASAETRAKISAVQKGQPGRRKGIPHTPESKAKMAAASLARWERMTPEQKEKKADILREAARDITNSSIEDVIAQRLDAQGILYERQKLIGWNRVDFYIEAENHIIEVHGCYWHACEQCQQKGKHIVDNYEQKRAKDKKRYEYLTRKGYVVEIVWEHDLPRKR